ELVAAVRAALESRTLKVANGVQHADVLKRELLDFRVRVTAAANETFSAREGTHDDLVLAVALPVWLSGALEGQPPYIVGHTSLGRIENRSPALRALTMGGVIEFTNRRRLT